MFRRITLIDRTQDQKPGKFIHKDPQKGPPRHDLRKMKRLPDPILDKEPGEKLDLDNVCDPDLRKPPGLK